MEFERHDGIFAPGEAQVAQAVASGEEADLELQPFLTVLARASFIRKSRNAAPAVRMEMTELIRRA